MSETVVLFAGQSSAGLCVTRHVARDVVSGGLRGEAPRCRLELQRYIPPPR